MTTQLEVSLRGGLFLLNADHQLDTRQDDHLTVLGTTSDLSAKGVSLILPSFPLNEQLCDQTDRTLGIRIEFPIGSIEVKIAPVRCRPLDEKDPWRGYLVGARIVDMNNEDRTQLDNYLGTRLDTF